MPLIPGPHKGILREETLILRHLFGIGCRTSSIPYLGSSLTGSPVTDMLLVSVDVETKFREESILPNQRFHIGVSIFDTRCLANLDRLDLQEAITSYQFANIASKPCRKSSKNFIRGETEWILIAQISERISLLIHGRDYMLVAHGPNEDVKFLNLLDPNIVSNARYVMDTNKAAQFPLQLYYRLSLEKLLHELGIEHDWLHIAGNDAFFALKALLMLVVRDANLLLPVNRNSGTNALLDTLQAIALAPYALPGRPGETSKPPAPEPPKKLGLRAKRRLRAEVKVLRRLVEGISELGDLPTQMEGCDNPAGSIELLASTRVTA